jgi:hypothetical protein
MVAINLIGQDIPDHFFLARKKGALLIRERVKTGGTEMAKSSVVPHRNY